MLATQIFHKATQIYLVVLLTRPRKWKKKKCNFFSFFCHWPIFSFQCLKKLEIVFFIISHIIIAYNA